MLPVLPAMLSASGSGGRRRPLGIVLGLTTTFAITIVGIAKVVGGVGLGADPLRDVAIAVPDRVRRGAGRPRSSASASSARSRRSRGWARARAATASPRACSSAARSGFVYTPCAGPILAAVISVSAASGRAVAVGLAYAARAPA